MLILLGFLGTVAPAMGQTIDLNHERLYHQVTTATVNDNNVRLRAIPDLDSSVVTLLSKNEEVEIICCAEAVVPKGLKKSFWFKVYARKSLIGWVYGTFLTGMSNDAVPIISLQPSDHYEKVLFANSIVGEHNRAMLDVTLATNDYQPNSTLDKARSTAVAFISVDLGEIKTSVYFGYFEGWSWEPGKGRLDFKVIDPVYFVVNGNQVTVDTAVNIYDRNTLTDTEKMIHFVGLYKEPQASDIAEKLTSEKKTEPLSEIPSFTVPRTRGSGTILRKNWIDLVPLPGPDVHKMGQAHNPQIEVLLDAWKKRGLYSGRDFKSVSELKQFINTFGGGFDFTGLDKSEINRDVNFGAAIVENGNYSFYIFHWGDGGSYSIGSITVFTPEDTAFPEIKIGDTIDTLVSRYGDFNFKVNTNQEDWVTYANKDDQNLGLRVQDGKVLYFGLTFNYFF
jgi:hypothetical protein